MNVIGNLGHCVSVSRTALAGFPRNLSRLWFVTGHTYRHRSGDAVPVSHHLIDRGRTTRRAQRPCGAGTQGEPVPQVGNLGAELATDGSEQLGVRALVVRPTVTQQPVLGNCAACEWEDRPDRDHIPGSILSAWDTEIEYGSTKGAPVGDRRAGPRRQRGGVSYRDGCCGTLVALRPYRTLDSLVSLVTLLALNALRSTGTFRSLGSLR